MKYCVVEIKTQTATFRNPEFQNFHKSFLLPPPTTLIGLAGAALGLSPKAVQDYFDSNTFQIGVYGKSQGLAKDLWKYNTFNGQGSIIMKEILFDNHFVLVYGSDNESIISELKEAFLNPVYALSLGNNDSLAKIINVEVHNETVTSKNLESCLVEGDIVAEVFSNVSKSMDFSVYTTSEPITFDLPTQFAYKAEYGVRSVIKRQAISFIGQAMRLNIEKECILYKDIFIPVFTLNNTQYA